jgi:UDP-N-acetylmuramate dehydrogenase
MPLLPLGGCSNVVLPDVLEAVVLRAGDDSIQVIGDEAGKRVLRVGAARDWHAFVLWSVAEGYGGLENLALIPGSVGAAPVQNIGAYGRELQECVVAVHGHDLRSGEARSLSSEECRFAYRSSVFKEELGDRFLIRAVDFRLAVGGEPRTDYPSLSDWLARGAYGRSAQEVCRAVIDLRRERLPDPQTNPNAGSFFKNPIVTCALAEELLARHASLPVYRVDDERTKLSAGWLIEAAGLRGFALGPVRSSPRHALVLENTGGAGQDDVLALAARIREQVLDHFGVRLEVEPRVYSRAAVLEATW